MAILRHEVWIDEEGLPGMCLAGPMGDAFRALLGGGAQLVTTIDASSHFEAMQKYNAYLDREPYTTDQEWDYQPYPDDWLRVQAASQ